MIQVNDGWRIQVQYLGNFKNVLGLNMFIATTHGTYLLTGMNTKLARTTATPQQRERRVGICREEGQGANFGASL